MLSAEDSTRMSSTYVEALSADVSALTDPDLFAVDEPSISSELIRSFPVVDLPDLKFNRLVPAIVTLTPLLLPKAGRHSFPIRLDPFSYISTKLSNVRISLAGGEDPNVTGHQAYFVTPIVPPADSQIVASLGPAETPQASNRRIELRRGSMKRQHQVLVPSRSAVHVLVWNRRLKTARQTPPRSSFQRRRMGLRRYLHLGPDITSVDISLYTVSFT